MKKIGKYLALILRHDPAAGNLTLDKNGWADTTAVLEAVRTKYGSFSRTDLQELVAADDKQRYAFSAHGTKIRANQGHSVDVELGLVKQSPPEKLFHGTKRHYLSSILSDGLNKGQRQYVHLSPDIETARVVARRRSGNDVLLEIDASAMTDNDFYQSENGVWLIEHVPAQYITVIEWPN